MNNYIKLGIGVILGGGIGYFIGSVVVEVIHQKEFLSGDIDLEELDEIPEDANINEIDNILVRNQTKLKKNNQKIARVKNYAEYFQSQDRPDLAELAKKYNGDSERVVKQAIKDGTLVPVIDGMTPTHMIEDDFIDLSEEETTTQDPCIIISLEEFVMSGVEEKVTLNYFDDDVVTDEHNNPIRNPEEILGTEALVSFGAFSDDPDVVYVRNLEKDAMYEVVRTNRPYANDFGSGEAVGRRKITRKVGTNDDKEENS